MAGTSRRVSSEARSGLTRSSESLLSRLRYLLLYLSLPSFFFSNFTSPIFSNSHVKEIVLSQSYDMLLLATTFLVQDEMPSKTSFRGPSQEAEG